jgi:hypothetical protein
MGYRVEYKRIPLSRDRTPIASDIDHMQLQLKCKNPAGPPPTSHTPTDSVHTRLSNTRWSSTCAHA